MKDFKPITTEDELNKIIKEKTKSLRNRIAEISKDKKAQETAMENIQINRLKNRVDKLEQLLSILNVSVNDMSEEGLDQYKNESLNKLEFYENNYNKLSNELDEFENELEKSRKLILKLFIADSHDLPLAVAHRIKGGTEQEMISDCKKLKKYF